MRNLLKLFLEENRQCSDKLYASNLFARAVACWIGRVMGQVPTYENFFRSNKSTFFTGRNCRKKERKTICVLEPL